MPLSESPVSDLSISLTQSELEEDPPEGVAPETSATPSGASDDHNRRRRPESPLQFDSSEHTPQLNRESSAPAGTSERYSMCWLLYVVAWK